MTTITKLDSDDCILHEIEAGLRYHTGDKLPYFTIANEGYTNYELAPRVCRYREYVIQDWPELQQIVDLHLSDIYGEPMYAYENGLYWLAGAAGPKAQYLGQSFHGSCGTSSQTPPKCAEILTWHWRMPLPKVELFVSTASAVYSDLGPKALESFLRSFVDEQKPRWLAEANDCIDKFNLQVFGAHWKGEEAWRKERTATR